MKLRSAAVLAIATCGIGIASAQQFKPEDQIKYRQSLMEVMTHNLGVLGAMAKGDVPFNKDVAASSATLAELASKQIAGAFGPGTEKGAPTRADMRIWSDPDKFRDATNRLVNAVAKLPAANDAAALKTAMSDIGPACKNCHDNYRLKDPRN